MLLFQAVPTKYIFTVSTFFFHVCMQEELKIILIVSVKQKVLLFYMKIYFCLIEQLNLAENYFFSSKIFVLDSS